MRKWARASQTSTSSCALINDSGMPISSRTAVISTSTQSFYKQLSLLFFCCCFLLKTKRSFIPQNCSYLGRTRTSRTGGEARRRPNSDRVHSELASLGSFSSSNSQHFPSFYEASAAWVKCFPKENQGGGGGGEKDNFTYSSRSYPTAVITSLPTPSAQLRLASCLFALSSVTRGTASQ